MKVSDNGKIKIARIKQKIEAIGNETDKRPKAKNHRHFHSTDAYLTSYTNCKKN
jgi:hypothetical protein